MDLISKTDLLEASPAIRRMGGSQILSVIFRILRFDKVNSFYSEQELASGEDFLKALISHTGIKVSISDHDLKKIPVSGSFITVSNHPYGGIDGILLARYISEINPQYKILVNFLLTRIRPLQPFFLGVNPFESRKDVRSSFGGLKEALHHLQTGAPLGIFPAGEVSSFRWSEQSVTDREWQFSMLKFIKRARVPVIPVYFSGHNSVLFNLLGMIHPMLRTIRLPAELFNKNNHEISIRIGSPVTLKEQDACREIHDYGKMLRMKSYSLRLSPDVTRSVPVKPLCTAVPVIGPVDHSLIVGEIESITKEFLLFSIHDSKVFCAPSSRIPNIMREIGRLREITYRQVGEGTDREVDIDRYDAYFEQLFIWDDEVKTIVGGYRVGRGDEIIDRFGIEGHYIYSLFRIDRRMIPVLKVSLELGRSFIVKDHQKKPLSLFLLWKGIFYLLLKAPRYRFLLGPVSIPNEFPEISKGFVVEFLKAHFYNSEYGSLIRPRNAFRSRASKLPDLQQFLRYTNKDISLLEKFIHDIEPQSRLPILLKKYLSVNSEVLGFNVDPLFSNCLDTLIILDLFEVPFEKIESLSKEIQDHTILERFRKQE